jgi:hypothetical protein
VHDEAWLDFHTCQSGHARNSPNWRFIEDDYARTPARPCMDAEPGYEDMADDIRNLDGGYLDDWDARKALYWGLFAGAHGHTYGCNPVWQMWHRGRQPLIWPRRPWYEAIHLPGSSQMQHARALLLSRPFLDRIPDQSLVVSEVGTGTRHVRATRHRDGSYALVYLPAGDPVELDLSKLAGEKLARHWFDPRTGTARSIGVAPKNERATFTPPPGGPDWILVLDDTARGYPAPGNRQS